MRTLIGPSIVYNLQRAVCAGITLSIIFAVFAVLSLLEGGASRAPFPAEFSDPASATANVIGFALAMLAAPIIYVPVGLIAAWLRRQMGEVRIDLSIGGILGLYFALMLNVLSLTCLIVLMLGDPGVLLLKHIAPDFVPVDRPKLWNPYLLIRVEGDPDEIAAAQAQTRAQQHQDYQTGAANLNSLYEPSPTPSTGAQPTAPEWLDLVAGIENDALRNALELANYHLDTATKIVHPPNAITAAKADEIDRLLGLVRNQLEKARAENDATPENGVASYIELLEACCAQYGGIALAIGRRQLAEGARRLEAVAATLERIARETGGDASAVAQSRFMLCLIYWEMGERGDALASINRAISAKPDELDYRRVREQIQGELAASASVEAPRQSGGLATIAIIGTLVLLGGGAAAYFWQSSQTNVEAAIADPNAFEVLPYIARETVVARESESNIRTLPFARPDIPVLRESMAGEVLHVTGLVNQADGAWYQIRLSDGRIGYFKASLVVAQAQYLETMGPPLRDGVYIQQGVCPFEGCIYGPWRSTAVTRLYRTPNENAPIAATIMAGESVTALRGEVHLIPLRGVVIRPLGPFRTGDVIYRLSYRGEGTWDVWHNGTVADTFNLDYWSSPPVFDFGAGANTDQKRLVGLSAARQRRGRLVARDQPLRRQGSVRLAPDAGKQTYWRKGDVEIHDSSNGDYGWRRTRGSARKP